MSWLDLSGLNYFLSKLKSKVKLSETRYVITTSTSQTVSYTVPDFSPSVMVLDVYINGLHCIPSVDYVLNANVVTMKNELEAGQTIEFVKRWVTL